MVRGLLRRVLGQMHFVNDNIAIFDLPALEIDTEVDGLMVIRGVTLSVSTLTLEVHGVEVGIKLSDDMELALQTEKVTIRLFRRIDIGDVYANIKGGAHEMTFGNLDARTKSSDGEPLMVFDSPLLQRAATTGILSTPPLITMTSKMTGGKELEKTSPKRSFGFMTAISPDSEAAVNHYLNMLKWIDKTNMIHQCRKDVLELLEKKPDENDPAAQRDLRAAISTSLHWKPSIPHPPRVSVRVTTLKNISSPRVKTFLHRVPMLLRLLLNPISYFHPVFIKSVVASGSGKLVTSQLQQHIFRDYPDENAELRRLKRRIVSWLSDANFVLGLEDITGLSQVPFVSAFDISCYLKIDDVMAYRTLISEEINWKQVVRIGGADASFSIPLFLLPHHEHLLPPVPTEEKQDKIKFEAAEADGKPKTLQKERELEQTIKDEANVKMSVHARLPTCFDQELLNFVAALAKATKVVELEKEPGAMDDEVQGFKEFAKSLNKGVKDGMKKAVVDGVVNDRWIAKMVGKITKKLETAQGELGYSGDIPVALALYRLPEGHKESDKILL